MAVTTAADSDPGADLDAATRAEGLRMSFQPIVSLPGSEIVGYEALARWPRAGLPDPVSVFAHAARTQRLDSLDQACITAAVNAAFEIGLPRGSMLAVNCEPASRYVPQDGGPMSRAAAEYVMVVELTERGLLSDPAALLSKVEQLRCDGFAVALDDVGAHADSLALLDIVEPDVIKLDLNLIHGQTHRHQSQTLAAVLAYHERTGAVIVAEGIESELHLERAVAVGAALGQGFRFGRPHTPGIEDLATVAPRVALLPDRTVPRPVARPADSPFDRAAREPGVSVRTARKETLTAFSRHIERQAADTVDPAMIFAAVQDSKNLSTSTLRRYETLARTAPLTAILGRGVPAVPAPGVRGFQLDATDPLCLEWTVVTLGPRTASALIARERPPRGPVREDDRLFDFVLTFDRSLVAAVGGLLLGRIHAAGA